MAQFSLASLTNAGAALQQKLEVSGDPLELTRVGAGNGQWSASDDLAEATALRNQKQTFTISSIDVDEFDQTQVKAVATNLNLASAYYMTEIGIYANDPDEGEILYSISVIYNESEADYLPAYNGSTMISVTLISYFNLSPTINVTIQSQTGYASAHDFTELMDNIIEMSAATVESICEEEEA